MLRHPYRDLHGFGIVVFAALAALALAGLAGTTFAR